MPFLCCIIMFIFIKLNNCFKSIIGVPAGEVFPTTASPENPGKLFKYMFGTNSICYQRPKAGYET